MSDVHPASTASAPVHSLQSLVDDTAARLRDAVLAGSIPCDARVVVESYPGGAVRANGWADGGRCDIRAHLPAASAA